ncbi:substrate-binding domain-containing protein [Hydrogenophaga sp.]|uniref:helix-turn-helix transcriptional regulator n=1 Tax=Hydrogenophaga sp. TaxID=1904254 RepID=UPI00261269B6|nr:substrate-binding domain-containing protein [Hydrogenophaga sp.]MCW5653622.1 helix-turn-helix transcriptional regulator [Hydrogenophaga sp.]
MRKIELSYTHTAGAHPDSAQGPLLRNPMQDLLQALHASGSISGAARALGLSYRHVWGQLKAWEGPLGQPLVFWERGQAARLTPFGERLLLAERMAQARLAPQLEQLQTTLARAYEQAIDEDATLGNHLTLCASHDLALGVFQQHCSQPVRGRSPAPPLHLDIRYCGSTDAIRSLSEGRCDVAGFHTQSFATAGSLSARSHRPLLKPGLHKLIGFAQRVQGLLVAPGNPLGLRTVADLAQKRARFVNRGIGTGTRLLFDELLAQAGVQPQAIDGHSRVEPTHAAVALSVACGTADAGLGTEYAASAHGLDFVPLTEERYVLACLKSTLERTPAQYLVRRLRSRAWQEQLNALPGYAADHCGDITAMKRLLPWWG